MPTFHALVYIVRCDWTDESVFGALLPLTLTFVDLIELQGNT